MVILFTIALPRRVAGPVYASRVGLTLVTQLAFPTILTPKKETQIRKYFKGIL